MHFLVARVIYCLSFHAVMILRVGIRVRQVEVLWHKICITLRQNSFFFYFLNWGIVHLQCCVSFKWGFPGGSDSKDSACIMGDPGPIPGSGRSPGEENGNPLQYSCLENSLDRGAWRVPVHGVATYQMTEEWILYFFVYFKLRYSSFTRLC